MKLLSRNKSELFYAQYIRSDDVIDYYGNIVGSAKGYTNPVMLRANISTASGTAQAEQFGTNIQYDKVVITDDMACPINEDSILWIDIVPADSKTPHNYIVKRVAKSQNFIAYAVTKVNVR